MPELTHTDLAVYASLIAFWFGTLGLYLGSRLRQRAYQRGYGAGFSKASAMYNDSANRVANVVQFPVLKAVG